jgi:hypothetical protein
LFAQLTISPRSHEGREKTFFIRRLRRLKKHSGLLMVPLADADPVAYDQFKANRRLPVPDCQRAARLAANNLRQSA